MDWLPWKFHKHRHTSVIFMKSNKAGKTFFYCEELAVVACVETNVDVLFDPI